MGKEDVKNNNLNPIIHWKLNISYYILRAERIHVFTKWEKEENVEKSKEPDNQIKCDQINKRLAPLFLSFRFDHLLRLPAKCNRSTVTLYQFI